VKAAAPSAPASSSTRCEITLLGRRVLEGGRAAWVLIVVHPAGLVRKLDKTTSEAPRGSSSLSVLRVRYVRCHRFTSASSASVEHLLDGIDTAGAIDL
jgi:hypothetical protein